MDGLKVYRQYLENIRLDICNYELDELKSSSFMPILGRMKEIEDLSYMDIILKKSNLDVSFFTTKDFLNKLVLLESSSLGQFFYEEDMEEEEQEMLDEVLSYFDLDAESYQENFKDIFGDEIPELTVDSFPQSGEDFLSPEAFLEMHKDTLSSVFGTLRKVSEVLEQKEKEEKEKLEREKERELSYVEDYFEEDEEVIEEDLESDFENSSSDNDDFDKDSIKDEIDKESVSDIDSGIEDNFKEILKDEKSESDEVFEKKEIVDDNIEDDLEDSFEGTIENDLEDDLENDFKGNIGIDDDLEEDIEEDYSVNRVIDTRFLEEDEVEEDNESIENLGSKNFSMFLDEEDDYDEDTFTNHFPENEEDEEEEDIEVRSSRPQKSFIDRTHKALSEEVEDEEDNWVLNDTDPVDRSVFEEATNYFLNGSNKKVNPIRDMYMSKEKIVDSEDVNGVDDALAKMVLAFSDNMFNFSGLFGKFKQNGSKLKNSMRVGDDDDEEDL